jgi:hypothetical protein
VNDWLVVGPVCTVLALVVVVVDRLRKGARDEAIIEARVAAIAKLLDETVEKVKRLDEDKASRADLAAHGDRIRDRVSGHVARLLLPGRTFGPPSE